MLAASPCWGSCGLVGGELVKQGRGSGGFSGEGSARRAPEVTEMQPVSPPAPCYPTPKSSAHSTELRLDTAESSSVHSHTTGATFPHNICSPQGAPASVAPWQQTTLAKDGTQLTAGFQPGCCVHGADPATFSAIGSSALSIPERCQPALLAGGASLEMYISQVFQKLPRSKAQMPSQTQTHLILPP